MKKALTLLLLLLNATFLYAQRRPGKEILIFFASGTEQQHQYPKKNIDMQAKITSERLKFALEKLGILENMLEVALPKFKQADTLQKLDDGSIIPQMDMTKLFRLMVPQNTTKKDLIAKLNSIPEVLYAEENGTVTNTAVPNDTQYFSQWGGKTTSQ